MEFGNPLVSFLIATYNPVREYFLAALQSVIHQTYDRLEIVVVNDGSTVNIREMIDELNDDRIVLVDNSDNKGLTKCLNQGLAYCTGEFIARMDDDDICEPNRIEEQVKAFVLDKSINILGCDTKVFGEETRTSHYILQSTREKQQVDLFFANASIAHPTAMLRKAFLEEYKISYNENYVKSQDYGLWVDCVQYSKINCLGKVLLNYRTHSGQASCKNRDIQTAAKNKIRLEQLHRVGISPTDDEFALHIRFCEGQLKDDYKELKALGTWIKKLKKENKRSKYFDKKTFKKTLGKKFIVQWYGALMGKEKAKKLCLGMRFLDLFFNGVL